MMANWSCGVSRFLAAAVSIVLLCQAADVRAAGCGCPICVSQCGPAYELVERTVNVPTIVLERRTIQVTECRMEPRQRTITVNKCVPEVSQITENYIAMVPREEMRKEVYHVQKPVWREVERRVVAHVPHIEKRQGVRQVCRPVQVDEMRTVCRDVGHWEEVPCAGECGAGGYVACCPTHRRFGCGWSAGCCGKPVVGCGYDAGCGGGVAPHTHRVWRPQVITEQVPVKVWRTEMVEEPYEYRVTVYRPEERVERVKVCEYVTEERTRDVRVTICVPEQRSRVRNITTLKVVSEPRVVTYYERVPYQVTRDIQVPVCRMVPKTIVCRVPLPMGCATGCVPSCGCW